MVDYPIMTDLLRVHEKGQDVGTLREIWDLMKGNKYCVWSFQRMEFEGSLDDCYDFIFLSAERVYSYVWGGLKGA